MPPHLNPLPKGRGKENRKISLRQREERKNKKNFSQREMKEK